VEGGVSTSIAMRFLMAVSGRGCLRGGGREDRGGAGSDLESELGGGRFGVGPGAGADID
jgi:hypothetical protein